MRDVGLRDARDQGVIFSMKREGVPKEVQAYVNKIKEVNERFIKQNSQGRQIKENPLAGFPYNENKHVLGVRVEFMKRGYNWFTVRPPLPIKVPGSANQSVSGLSAAVSITNCG
jgi:hypothetical protein